MPPKHRRIAILGFRSVGKSALTIQFIEGRFVSDYQPTIENNLTKDFRTRGHDYQVTLVDTAGQDEYSIFPTQYSMDIHGYVLVYSIVDPRSLEVIKVIYDKLLNMTGKVNVPIVLVGNKNDLKDERKVTVKQGRKAAEGMKALFLEASAKNGGSVTDIFDTVLWLIEKKDAGHPRIGVGDGGDICKIT